MKKENIIIVSLLFTIALLSVALMVIVAIPDKEQVYYNTTTDLSEVTEAISKIPSCPSCSCPKYEVKVCEEVSCEEEIRHTNNILSLDKFKFRMEIIEDNYNLLKEKIEDDDDKSYCKDNIPKLKEDIDIALSYTQEFVNKEGYEESNQNMYSYKILEECQNHLKAYLDDVNKYCKNDIDNIKESKYDIYVTYVKYYNNISNSSDFSKISKLKNIRE